MSELRLNLQPGSQLTQSSLVSLLSIQWLKNLTVLKPSQPSPDLHSHTTHYNSSTIPVPAPAAVPHKYRHLQEQTPSLSEHHHIPQDSWGEGGRKGGREKEGGEDGAKRRDEKRREERSRWKDEHSRCREKRINRERKDKINTLSMREGTQFTVLSFRISHRLFLFLLI